MLDIGRARASVERRRRRVVVVPRLPNAKHLDADELIDRNDQGYHNEPDNDPAAPRHSVLSMMSVDLFLIGTLVSPSPRASSPRPSDAESSPRKLQGVLRR